MIQNDTQLHQAQADIQKLWRFLESARQTYGSADYERLAAPYLLQIQERQQEVLDYLSAKPKPEGRMIPPTVLFRKRD